MYLVADPDCYMTENCAANLLTKLLEKNGLSKVRGNRNYEKQCTGTCTNWHSYGFDTDGQSIPLSWLLVLYNITFHIIAFLSLVSFLSVAESI